MTAASAASLDTSDRLSSITVASIVSSTPTVDTVPAVPDETTKKKWQVNDAYDDGPDGGFGWLVVAGAFLGQFTSFGIMQEYYEREVFSHIPDAQLQLSFAGTIMELFVDLMGPLFQIISARYGVRAVLILGSFLGVLGLEMAGFTTQIWHLYLTQGVLFGSGASFMYVAAMSVPAQWFNRRRGLGLGLVSSGSGVGGLVLPFVMTALNNKLGAAWTYRIMGFLVLGMNVFTCLLVKEKYPRHKKYKANDESGEKQPTPHQPTLREIFNWNVLKDINYLLWVIGSMIALMGFFVPFFFLPSYARYLGLSSANGTALIAVMSAGNCVGRVAVGYIGDRIGRLNADIVFTFISGISALTIWVFANNYGTLMAFAAVFGLVCSSYVALLSPITATILGIDRFPTGLSILLLSNMVSVFGPSIASAIESRIDAEPYLTYKVFTGVTYIVGGFILIALKLRMTRSLTAKI
ncbi:major facilitator superfamily domain-containing protein [Fennellomyces sp. T-0311]|nr:major facilitator superfamily domain-containing protein [Fennellomyces sp. T-0311]